MSDTFDPAAVPAFPVLTLHRDDQQRLVINGRPDRVVRGDDWHRAGTDAIARLAREQGLDAVRVRAVDGDSTTEHRFVVTVSGQTYPLPEDTAATPAPPRMRRRILIVATAMAGCVVLGLGGTVAYRITHAPEPTATPTWQLPHAGANIPVVLPPGTAEQAAWATPVDASATVTQISTSRVLTTGTDGNLIALDARTGKTVWHGKGAPAGNAIGHLSQIGSAQVFASDSGGSLSAWVLSDIRPGRVSPQQVKIPSGATVTYDGSTPLVDLGDQTAATITTAGRLRRVDVPITASVILATNSAVIATNGTRWWSIDRRNVATEHPLPRPTGTTGAASRVVGLDASHILAIWQGAAASNGVAAVIDLARNQVTASAALPSGAVPSQTDVLHAPTGDVAAIGDVVVRYGTRPAISVTDGFTPSVITADAVYGLQQSTPVTAAITDARTLCGQPFTATTIRQRVLPGAVTAGHVFVVAEKVDATYLYAAPRTEGTAP